MYYICNQMVIPYENFNTPLMAFNVPTILLSENVIFFFIWIEVVSCAFSKIENSLQLAPNRRLSCNSEKHHDSRLHHQWHSEYYTFRSSPAKII